MFHLSGGSSIASSFICFFTLGFDINSSVTLFAKMNGASKTKTGDNRTNAIERLAVSRNFNAPESLLIVGLLDKNGMLPTFLLFTLHQRKH